MNCDASFEMGARVDVLFTVRVVTLRDFRSPYSTSSRVSRRALCMVKYARTRDDYEHTRKKLEHAYKWACSATERAESRDN